MYLVLYECIEVYSFINFAWTNRYVLVPPSWSSIEVPMRCSALLPASVSYLGSRLRDDANSGLWVLAYTGWAASCARHLLLGAYEYHWRWYFCPVLRVKIKVLDLPTFLGGQSNANELEYLTSVIVSVDWKTVPAAINLKTEGLASVLVSLSQSGRSGWGFYHTRSSVLKGIRYGDTFGLSSEVLSLTVKFGTGVLCVGAFVR